MGGDSEGAARAALLLLQFARAPRAGEVKTRLMPVLGAAGACALHCELTQWTWRQLLASGLGPVEVSVDGNAAHPLFARCREEGVVRVSTQYGDDLGARMHHALREALSRFTRVILVGSDCPGIDATYLRLAAEGLRSAAVVLGPALDGGYVLIGVRAISAGVFTDIPWGSDRVFAKTVAALDEAGLDWLALPALADIDRPEDLPVWAAIKRGSATAHTAMPASE